MTSWMYLIVAIMFEVAGTTSMKLSNGFTNLWPSVLIFIFYGLSFTAFTFCLKEMDVGVAYAVWCGLGMSAIAVIGVVMFGETFTLLKLASIVLIFIGILGLNISGAQG
jgi:small multidrug resistance pump